MNNVSFSEKLLKKKKKLKSDVFRQGKCKGKIMLALLKRSYGKFSTICMRVTTIY